MKCEQINALIPEFLSGGADEDSKIALTRHLHECGKCRAEVEQLQIIWQALGSIPEQAPPAALRERFHKMLDAYKSGLAAARPAPRLGDAMNAWLARWWPRQPLLQLGVAMFLLLAGLWAGRSGENRQNINSLRREVASMQQMLAISLLNQSSPSERLKGVRYSLAVAGDNQRVIQALLDALRHDPNVNVRLAAVEALDRFADAREVRAGVAAALVHQSSPAVQIALIDFLVRYREKNAVGVLRELMRAPQVMSAVKERAAEGISRIM